MNQDIKLVIDHLDRLLIKGTVNYQLVDSAATMLKTLGNKVAQQAAVIEKLREALTTSDTLLRDLPSSGGLYGIAVMEQNEEALATPTDSKQILADWMREQLGEPVFYQHESGAISTNDIDMNAGKRTALVRLPEYLK